MFSRIILLASDLRAGLGYRVTIFLQTVRAHCGHWFDSQCCSLSWRLLLAVGLFYLVVYALTSLSLALLILQTKCWDIDMMLTVPVFVSAQFHSWLLCLPCSGSLVFAYTAISSVQCLCCLVSTTSALTEVFTTSRGTRPSMLLFTASSVGLGQCFHCCACYLMCR